MKITLLGRGSESLLTDFDSAGIEYERWLPKPGQIMNAGLWVKIAENTPWSALSKVFVAWLRGRASRKVTITQNDNKILHIEGTCQLTRQP